MGEEIGWRDRQGGTDGHRQTGRETGRETDRQTDRQTDRDRQTETDRQTDRQTDTYTKKKAEEDTEAVSSVPDLLELSLTVHTCQYIHQRNSPSRTPTKRI